MASSIMVAVRVRPDSKAEQHQDGGADFLRVADDRTVILSNPLQGRSEAHSFSFDNVLDSRGDAKTVGFASQEDVFDVVGKGVVEATFTGYNATVFAYGQTGSGKSYTMMGLHDPPQEAGLTPRLAKAIFKEAAARTAADSNLTFEVNCSYMEIYNERVFDLLDPCGGRDKSLPVREAKRTGPFVDGLTEFAVDSFESVAHLIQQGNTLRHVASTAMNATSSRSHAVFEIHVKEITTMDGVAVARQSRVNLVDLAGSERQKTSKSTGLQLKEGAAINKSLSTLGRVISAVVKMQGHNSDQAQHIPYRSSLLTWLLSESFGGNARTVMMATVSPSPENFEETLGTLRYAACTRKMKNTAVVNESKTDRVVRDLKETIMALQQELAEAQSRGVSADKLREMQEATDTNQALLRKEISSRKGQLAFTKSLMAKTARDLESSGVKLLYHMKMEQCEKEQLFAQEAELEKRRISSNMHKDHEAALAKTIADLTAARDEEHARYDEHEDETQHRITSLEEERNGLICTVAAANAERNAARTDVSTIEAHLHVTETMVTSLREEIAERDALLFDARHHIDEAKSTHTAEQAKLDAKQIALEESLSQLHEAKAAAEDLRQQTTQTNDAVCEIKLLLKNAETKCESTQSALQAKEAELEADSKLLEKNEQRINALQKKTVDHNATVERIIAEHELIESQEHAELAATTQRLEAMEFTVTDVKLEIAFRDDEVTKTQHRLDDALAAQAANKVLLEGKQGELDAAHCQLEQSNAALVNLQKVIVTREDELAQAHHDLADLTAVTAAAQLSAHANLDTVTSELRSKTAAVAELTQTGLERDAAAKDTQRQLDDAVTVRDANQAQLQANQVELTTGTALLDQANTELAAQQQLTATTCARVGLEIDAAHAAQNVMRLALQSDVDTATSRLHQSEASVACLRQEISDQEMTHELLDNATASLDLQQAVFHDACGSQVSEVQRSRTELKEKDATIAKLQLDLREAIAATDAEVARSQYSLESALKITSQLEAKLNIAHTDGTALQKKMSVTDAEWADLEVQLGAAVAELGTLRATLSTLRSSALSNEIFWPLQRHAIHESDVTVSQPQMQINKRASLLGSNRAVHNLTSTESDRGGLRDKLSVVELERDTAVRELEKTRQQMTCTKETIAQIRVEAKREIQAAKKHERDKEAELNAKLREADEYGSFLNSCCVM